jgi:hypothetical protein
MDGTLAIFLTNLFRCIQVGFGEMGLISAKLDLFCPAFMLKSKIIEFNVY